MRGTAEEIWGEKVDPYGVMRTTAADWTDDHERPKKLSQTLTNYWTNGNVILLFFIWFWLANSTAQKINYIKRWNQSINQSINTLWFLVAADRWYAHNNQPKTGARNGWWYGWEARMEGEHGWV
jgi:hypothetical protein